MKDYDSVYDFKPGFKFQFKLNVNLEKYQKLKTLYNEYPYSVFKVSSAVMLFTGGYLHIHNSGSKLVYRPHKAYQIKFF